MNPALAEALTAFLRTTLPAFEAREARLRTTPDRVVEPKELDLGSYSNTVAVYDDPECQLVYTNMYLAKHLGCWRWLRSRLGANDATSVVSIGAGPHLCLWGWFADQPPMAGQTVHAVDALPWNAILGLPEHAAVATALFGDPGTVRVHRAYIPPGVRPAQLQALEGLQALAATAIPEGAVVLLPFLLNHLVGATGPLADTTPLIHWLEAVRARARAIIIVDLPASRAANFWPAIYARLGLAPATATPTFTFREYSLPFGECYPERYNWRWRRTSDLMTTASGLVGTRERWWPVEPNWQPRVA